MGETNTMMIIWKKKGTIRGQGFDWNSHKGDGTKLGAKHADTHRHQGTLPPALKNPTCLPAYC